MSDNPTDRRGSGRIDLGFRSLLTPEGCEEAVAEIPSVQPAAPYEQLPQKDLTEFEKLATAGSWSELAQQSEAKLDLPGAEAVDAKLWWVNSQLELKSLPASFLAAPLETAAREVQKDGALSHLKDRTVRLLDRLCALLKESSPEISISLGDLRNSILPASIVAPTSKPEITFDTAVPPQPKPQSKMFRRAAIIMLVLLILAGGTYLLYPSSTLEIQIAEVSADAPIETAMLEPNLVPRTGAGGLEALAAEMNEHASQVAQSAPTLAPAVPTTKEKLPDVADKKDDINVDGPLEPAWMRNRVIRQPVEREPETDSHSGPIVTGYPVEKFSEGRLYEVIQKTTVLSEPSVNGRVIGQLKEGDKVLVEAKLGRWLRLRSRKERPGFVSADALANNNYEEFSRDGNTPPLDPKPGDTRYQDAGSDLRR